MTVTLHDAYVAGAAQAFYPSHFASAAARRVAVDAAARPLAPEVARVLSAQNARYAPSPARDAHLQALRDGAAAVVTGQQVGLLLGPLYTIYKAATAIVAARALAAESGTPVVPVFWLQTEDHDLPEIATAHVPTSAGETLTLGLPVPSEHRSSVATARLPPEVSECIRAVEDELGHFPNAASHLEHLRSAYAPGTTYGAAFAAVLAELFASEGLVLLDPRDPAFAAAACNVHERALREHAALSSVLCARSDALMAAGFEPAVPVRADASLSFFHAGGPDGPRMRLRVEGERFIDGERSHTLAELLAALHAEPLCFSTSALLRPLVQDTLLPTAMYVGGPAEVAYFAQLSPVYEALGMCMPLILPRARFVVVEDKARKLLSRLGLTARDAALSEDALLSLLASREPDAESIAVLTKRLGDALSATLDAQLAALGALPAEVSASADKTRATLRSSAEKLMQKLERARTHADQARVADVRRLRHMLQPGGAPQERVFGVSHYAARYGERAFIECVVAAVQPFDIAVRELSP